MKYNRTYNFSAGPAMMPEPVLEEIRDEMMNYRGSGMCVMEMSHRSKVFQQIAAEAEADLRDLMGIPDNYKVLFIQGGATLQLAAASFVIVVILSIPIGFLCAVYKDGWFDKVMRGLVFISTAMPAYWVGLLLMWGVSVKLGLLPTNGSGSWKHLVMPAFTVALSYISTYIRLIRNNMLENMKQDYVLYANVRGLPQKSILVKHILKNSMHTCIVAMGMSIPQLISGTIVVENVFSWPGLGTLCISSIFNRDLPVIQTYVLLIGVLFVVFNLVFDVLQTVSDPRLRREE